MQFLQSRSRLQRSTAKVSSVCAASVAAGAVARTLGAFLRFCGALCMVLIGTTSSSDSWNVRAAAEGVAATGVAATATWLPPSSYNVAAADAAVAPSSPSRRLVMTAVAAAGTANGARAPDELPAKGIRAPDEGCLLPRRAEFFFVEKGFLFIAAGSSGSSVVGGSGDRASGYGGETSELTENAAPLAACPHSRVTPVLTSASSWGAARFAPPCSASCGRQWLWGAGGRSRRGKPACPG